VIVADVYAAMGPPARLVESVQKEFAELLGRGLSATALKAEMDAEFVSAKRHEREVVDMVVDSHLLLPHDKIDLTDDALVQATARSVEHFKKHGVETVYISLGLDAAAGDREGAQVHEEGFKRMTKQLRASGLKLIFALEGGYHIGDLDVAHDVRGVFSGTGEVDHLLVNRYLGTGNFGKCVHAVASALVE